MFDPSGLKHRYVKLVAWDGLWVNYWTETVPKQTLEDGNSPRSEGSLSPLALDASNMEVQGGEEGKKERKKQKKAKPSPSRHFVVLPTGLGQILGGGEMWEKVHVHAVENEVEAHCGLFIHEQNVEYAKLVERVGQRIEDWCTRL